MGRPIASAPAVLALLLWSMAGVAAAQTATEADLPVASSQEFGRRHGGEINAVTKQGGRLSGSVGVTLGESDFPLAGGAASSRRYGATLGGTVVRDRVWFFASAEQGSTPRMASLAGSPDGMAVAPVSHSVHASMHSLIGSTQSLASSFASAQQAGIANAPVAWSVPGSSSFLSLRYTAMMSSNSFFNASFSQRNGKMESPFATFVRSR